MAEKPENPIEILLTQLSSEAVAIHATLNTLLLVGAEILAHLTDSDVNAATDHWLHVKEEYLKSFLSAQQEDLVDILKLARAPSQRTPQSDE